MSTIKLQIKNYLAEYLVEKFPCYGNRNLVQIPKQYDLHELIMSSLNSNSFLPYRNIGNVEIIIESSTDFFFISRKNRLLIERRIRDMFWTEAFYFLIVNRKCVHKYEECAALFLEKYKIKSLSEDAITKNFYRRRKKINH